MKVSKNSKNYTFLQDAIETENIVEEVAEMPQTYVEKGDFYNPNFSLEPISSNDMLHYHLSPYIDMERDINTSGSTSYDPSFSEASEPVCMLSRGDDLNLQKNCLRLTYDYTDENLSWERWDNLLANFFIFKIPHGKIKKISFRFGLSFPEKKYDHDTVFYTKFGIYSCLSKSHFSLFGDTYNPNDIDDCVYVFKNPGPYNIFDFVLDSSKMSPQNCFDYRLLSLSLYFDHQYCNMGSYKSGPVNFYLYDYWFEVEDPAPEKRLVLRLNPKEMFLPEIETFSQVVAARDNSYFSGPDKGSTYFTKLNFRGKFKIDRNTTATLGLLNENPMGCKVVIVKKNSVGNFFRIAETDENYDKEKRFERIDPRECELDGKNDYYIGVCSSLSSIELAGFSNFDVAESIPVSFMIGVDSLFFEPDDIRPSYQTFSVKISNISKEDTDAIQ